MIFDQWYQRKSMVKWIWFFSVFLCVLCTTILQILLVP